MLGQNNAVYAADAAQPPSPHETAQGDLMEAVSRIECWVNDLESKLAPSLAPAKPMPAETTVQAVQSGSAIHIVNNLESLTARLRTACDRMQDIHNRCGL